MTRKAGRDCRPAPTQGQQIQVFSQQSDEIHMKPFALLFLVSGLLIAQNPVTDGLMKAERLATEIREQQLIEQQTRLLVQQERQMRQQEQALRHQQELLREQEKQQANAQENTRVAAAEQGAQEKASSQAVIDSAIASVKRHYPDFDEFRDEMSRLLTLQDENKLGIQERIEALYLIAKYAMFSRSPLAVDYARSPTAPRPEARIAGPLK
jgi:hypothetical protein